MESFDNKQNSINPNSSGFVGNNIFNAEIKSINSAINEIYAAIGEIQANIGNLSSSTTEIGDLSKEFEVLKHGFNEYKGRYSEAITELQKQASDLKKENWKKKCHKLIKCFFSNWFLWIVLLFFGLGITMFLKFYPITEDKQVSVVLAFVGIAATFIVVSNYAQVKEVKDKVDTYIDKINAFEESINKVRADVFAQVRQIESNLSTKIGEMEKRVANNNMGIYSEIYRAKGLIYETHGDINKAISNYLTSIQSALELSYTPPMSDFIRVQAAFTIDEMIRLGKSRDISDIISTEDISRQINKIKSHLHYAKIKDMFNQITRQEERRNDSQL